MSPNLYGVNNKNDLQTSHVLPDLLRKFLESKEKGADSVTCWDTGTPKREILQADDLASVACFCSKTTKKKALSTSVLGGKSPFENWPSCFEKSRGFEGEIQWDDSKPEAVRAAFWILLGFIVGLASEN